MAFSTAGLDQRLSGGISGTHHDPAAAADGPFAAAGNSAAATGRRTPATVQEICEVAISRWLREQGFWKSSSY
ncbi:MAG UNVERIFIED_CONTAM: hypothetical protein LVR18_52435 [Planctomycetaceae bacterium]